MRRRKNEACYLGVSEAVLPPQVLGCNPETLTDLQLLAIVLGGIGGEAPAIDVADRLLDGASAARLRCVGIRRLRAVAGPAGALRLRASLELGRRALQGEGRRVLSSPRHVHEYARAYATASKEHFLAIHLTTRHVPSLLEIVSIGTINASLVHPREVFQRAIREGSANLILVHNHPSGDPAPSADDIDITTRLVKVGELVGIEVLDHVVLAGERYFSFREQGLLGG